MLRLFGRRLCKKPVAAGWYAATQTCSGQTGDCNSREPTALGQQTQMADALGGAHTCLMTCFILLQGSNNKGGHSTPAVSSGREVWGQHPAVTVDTKEPARVAPQSVEVGPEPAGAPFVLITVRRSPGVPKVTFGGAPQ